MSNAPFAGERMLALLSAFEAATGYRPALSTVVRWILKGIRGQRLEAKKIGGKWFASVEACQRFIAATNAPPESAPNEKQVPGQRPLNQSKRDRDIARDIASLEADGA